MARIRTVKPEYWSSEQVMALSLHARLAFIGLWNFCDDGGNHPASAKTLKAEVFPADELAIAEVQALVDELLTQGLIALYEALGKVYWHVTGWKRHQRIDKPTIKHPPPSELSSNVPGAVVPMSASKPQTIADHSASARGIIQEPSPNAPGVVAGPSPPEGNGKERKGDKPPIPPTPDGERGKVPRPSAIGLPAWLAMVKARGEKAILEGDPVFAYAYQVGLPMDFIRLAWREFRARYSEPHAKRYRDWRSVFRKAVRGNWLKLWYATNDGSYALTTMGMQAQRAEEGPTA